MEFFYWPLLDLFLWGFITLYLVKSGKNLPNFVALMLVSLGKILIAGTVMSLLAWLFYSFNIFVIGVSLVPFVVSLVVLGWTIGIITTSLILRFGQQAEILAWGIAILFQPISAVFYPVSVLPKPLRFAASINPASYVFEGMRELISTSSFPLDKLAPSFAINAVYMFLAFVFFLRILKTVRKKGLLSRIGE